MSDIDPSAKSSALVGTTLAGQFLIDKRIGEGGMGAVYLATQLGMDRKVVVKVMHPELTAGSANAVLRFQREARAVASLNHPNIVQVHVFGQSDDGQLYQAMEFIDGRDLASELTAGPMKQDRALLILAQITAALADAHAAGIVHRDLKPENIMLTDRHGNADWVKVLDFGIAKLREPETGKSPTALTQAGAVFGTPAYMAPEQVRGLTVDARTDLYAVGVILHEMVTGSHPFDALSPIDFLVKHVNDPVVPPGERFPQLNLAPQVTSMIERLLQKDPAARFQSAAELQQAIQEALSAGHFVPGMPGSPGLSASNPMLMALSQTPAAGLPGRPDMALADTVTHVPPERPKKKNTTALFVALGLLLAGGTVAAAVGLSGAGKTEGLPASVVAIPVDAPPAKPAAEPVVAAVAPTEPTPEEPVVVVEDTGDVVEPAEDVEAGADEDVEMVAEPQPPEDFEGFIAPPGSSLIHTSHASLKISVPLTPGEIFAFYAEAFPDTTRQIKNGLEFTDREFPYRSFTVGVDGVAIVLVALRRAPAVTRVDGVVRPPKPDERPPIKIGPPEVPTGPIPVRPPTPTPTQPAPEPTPAEPVVTQPETRPTPPPIIIQKPGTLPTEIRLPDGTVLPTGVPEKKDEDKRSSEEVYRAVKDVQKDIKDAVRGRGMPFIRRLGR